MMRGGHLDICVLGAFQVSAQGDLANWSTGAADAIPAVGGAMDLAIGAKQVFVMMEHLSKSGECKIVPYCSYPVTGIGCVDRIYTDLAVIDTAATAGLTDAIALRATADQAAAHDAAAADALILANAVGVVLDGAECVGR